MQGSEELVVKSPLGELLSTAQTNFQVTTVLRQGDPFSRPLLEVPGYCMRGHSCYNAETPRWLKAPLLIWPRFPGVTAPGVVDMPKENGLTDEKHPNEQQTEQTVAKTGAEEQPQFVMDM
ncbi:hypothetical protein ScPMuIL_004419 [Solemya velum]